jgi:hypothetical protein
MTLRHDKTKGQKSSMKLNQSALTTILAGILAGVFSFLSMSCHSAPAAAMSAAVQIDLGKLLNDRVIFTQKDGRLQMAQHSLGHETTSFLITKSAADISGAGKLNPLPDSGFFPANDRHPDVQLPYGIAGGGPQVHRSQDMTETYSISVPPNHYIQMQLFFVSADGQTPISIKLYYADGTSEQRTTLVPDFFFLPKPADRGWFVLAADFGKVDGKALMTEQTHHYIHGFDLDPDPAKELQIIEISKEKSGSVLNLFGATGKLSN